MDHHCPVEINLQRFFCRWKFSSGYWIVLVVEIIVFFFDFYLRFLFISI